MTPYTVEATWHVGCVPRRHLPPVRSKGAAASASTGTLYNIRLKPTTNNITTFYSRGDVARWLRATPAPVPLRRKVLLLQLAQVRYINTRHITTTTAANTKAGLVRNQSERRDSQSKFSEATHAA